MSGNHRDKAPGVQERSHAEVGNLQRPHNMENSGINTPNIIIVNNAYKGNYAQPDKNASGLSTGKPKYTQLNANLSNQPYIPPSE